MEIAAATAWQETLGRLVERVCVATGLELEAALRWASAEEQQAMDDDFDRRLADPNVQAIRLGAKGSDSEARSARRYEAHWVLVLTGQETTIHDDDDFEDLLEEYIIEKVWERTARAPTPGFLAGRPTHGAA